MRLSRCATMATAWGAGDVPKGRCPMKDFEEFEAIVASEENQRTESDLYDYAVIEAEKRCAPRHETNRLTAKYYAESLATHRLRLYHEWAAR